MTERPARHVNGQVLISGGRPGLRLEVASEFRFLGRLDIDLPGTDTEAFIFIDEDRPFARRSLIVQFEARLSRRGKPYHYDFDATLDLGGERYMHEVRCSNRSAFLELRGADSDTAQVAAFCDRVGITVPEERVHQRIVRLVDDGNAEVLLIYLEDATISGAKREEIGEGHHSIERWGKLAPGFLKRSAAAFTVL
ncbi:MAG TPA: hypothetical protein QGI71_04970 [Dehalococcoidia bacterium]|nr:hypothetical protein [Dehalococcoidia bacterium]